MARNTYDEDAYTREEFSHFQNILLNGTARIPICFCIDVSKSMNWLTNPSSDLIITGSDMKMAAQSTMLGLDQE